MVRVISVNANGESNNNSISVGGRFFYHRNGANSNYYIVDVLNWASFNTAGVTFRIWYDNM